MAGVLVGGIIGAAGGGSSGSQATATSIVFRDREVPARPLPTSMQADDGLPLVQLDDEEHAEEAWAGDPGKVIAAHRKAVLKADKAIRDRIRQELAGEA